MSILRGYYRVEATLITKYIHIFTSMSILRGYYRIKATLITKYIHIFTSSRIKQDVAYVKINGNSRVKAHLIVNIRTMFIYIPGRKTYIYIYIYIDYSPVATIIILKFDSSFIDFN